MKAIKYKILKNGLDVNLKLNILSETQNMGLATEINDDKFTIQNNQTITGFTTSKLDDVKSFNYAGPSHILGVNGVTEINTQYTGYTINDINYITDNMGVTSFSLKKTSPDINNKYFIHEEFYLGQAYNPIVDNQVDIERFNTSVTETLNRFELLNNVEFIGEYGGNYFNVSKQ